MSDKPTNIDPVKSDLITRIFVGVFVTILIIPLGSRFFIKDPAPYGRKPFITIEKPLALFLSGKTKNYKKLTDAAFERSHLVKGAITAKNKTLFKGFGYLDTDKVVSGKDGWLFYKLQFQAGRCYDDSALKTLANALYTTVSMGRTVGVPITVSMSPNKSTLYPEKIHPRSAWLTECMVQNSTKLRTIMAARIPGFINHADALSPFIDQQKLYYHTDTHWTHLGAYYGLRQLTAAISNIPEERFPLPTIRTDLNQTEKQTDLADIALLGMTEPLLRVDKTAMQSIRTALKAHPEHFIVLHDSFYGSLRVPDFFPRSTALNRDARTNNKQLEILLREQKQKHIIINMIERSFVQRNTYHFLANPLTLHVLLEQNSERARQSCQFVKLNSDEREKFISAVRNMEQQSKSGEYRALTNDPRIILNFGKPARAQCLRFRITTAQPDKLKIFLPAFHGTRSDNQWEPGRVLTYDLAAGNNEISILLPRNIRGQEIRIDPVTTAGAFTLGEIALGSIRKNGI